MKKNMPAKSGLVCRLLLTIFLPSLLLFTACKDGEPNGGGGVNSEVKINCVTLSKAQVQAWVDSGWTKPGSANEIKTLVLQFTTRDAASAVINMQLTGYPGQSAASVNKTGKTTLTVDTTCDVLKLSGEVIFANNVISLKKLNIFNEDGTLNDFEYIVFKPRIFDGDKEYINYKAQVVRKTGAAARDGDGDGGATWPCPPHCEPE